METRKLGTSGLEVSAIGLGCNNFGMRLDLDGSRAVIDRALDAGVTLFDTADMYGDTKSESFMGECFGPRRKDIVLATKFGFGAGGRAPRADRRYVFQAVEASLRRLKTDWIDLYQVHRFDNTTPVEETLGALDDLVRQGKVRYIGCSNFTAWQVVDADWTAKTRGLERFVSCQDEYSLVYRGIELDLLPAMRAKGLGLLPFFPLAGGLLTGKYKRGVAPPAGTRLSNPRFSKTLGEDKHDLVERLSAYAESRGHTLLELAFCWLLAQPGLASVIAGATSPSQVDANLAAANWKLSAEELADIGAILGPATPGALLG